jgi:murein DD-endopeptidase MepM/ murein hydrolase activator NlpD
MPAQGKHHHSRRFRFGVVAGLTTSVIVLPLVAAAGAQASEVPHTASQVLLSSGSSQFADNDGVRPIAHVAALSTNVGDRDDDSAVQRLVHHYFNSARVGSGTAANPAPAVAQPAPVAKPAAAAPVTSQSQTSTTLKTVPVAAPVAATTAAPVAASGYVAPLASLRVTEPYGVPGPWAAGHHTGIDLGASVGTSVKAIASGTVIHAGWDGAYGNDVIIKLADGKYVLTAHMSSVQVSVGQTVTAGEQIGLSGATGHVTGPHVHFEIRSTPYYGSDVNPVAYMQAHGVTL